MRAKWKRTVLAALSLVGVAELGACALTTDFDGYTGGDPKLDAGHLPDGAPILTNGDTGVGGKDAGVGEGGGPASYADLVLADHPIAYFRFDEAPGATTATDSIKNLQGAVGGGITFGEPGIAGTAVRSSLTADGIDFGDVLGFTGEQGFTFEAWVKTSLTDQGDFYEFFNKRFSTTNGIVMYVRRNNNGNDPTTAQLEESYTETGGGRGAAVELPSLDHFIHIVFVYDPSAADPKQAIRAWADGQHGDYGYSDPGGPTHSAETHTKIVDGTNGLVDEFAIYDYPLSDDRILAHYLKGSGKTP